MRTRKLIATLTLGAATLVPAPSSADGFGSLGLTYQEVLPGGGVVSEGVGLSTGRGGGPGSGTVQIAGVPGDAIVEKAFLYWSSYGGWRDRLQLNGATVQGAQVGSDGDTCWYSGGSTAFRADVTPLVSGNGAYTISALPGSGDATGASLVVIYFEPTAATSTQVQILDGLISTNNRIFDQLRVSFPLALVDDPISSRLHVGFGDGVPFFQNGQDYGGGEGPLLVNGVEVLPANSIEGSDGVYWDDHTVEVPVAAIDRAASQVGVSIDNGLDCLTWNYAALEIELPDSFGPFVRGVPDRPASPYGWHDGPVRITWEAYDGNGATQPPDTIADVEGRNVVYTSEPSCDALGNCSVGKIALSIDLGSPETHVRPMEVPIVGEPPVDMVSMFDGGAYGSLTDELSGVDTVKIELFSADGTVEIVEPQWFWCQQDAKRCEFGAEFPETEIPVQRVRIAAIDRAGRADETPVDRVMFRPRNPFEECPVDGLPMCEWEDPFEPVCEVAPVEPFFCEELRGRDQLPLATGHR